jgi:hypothetical protein
MTDIQKTYREVIVAVDGQKGMTFDKCIKDTSCRVGDAGLAIAVSVLEDGILKLSHLKNRIPDFTQTEIRMALSNLKKNGYFEYDVKDKLYRVCLDSDGVKPTDTVVWALMATVAQGWLARSNSKK